MNQPKNNSSASHHATLSGHWLVMMTLSLFLLIPTITYFAYQATQGTPPTVSLDYDQRDTWFTQPVKPRPLKYSKFVAAETGKQYKKTDLIIDPDVEAVLQQCARLSQSEDVFKNESTRDKLVAFANHERNGFYPPYLLATWFAKHRNWQGYEHWMRVAFDRSQSAITQRFVNAESQPIQAWHLPPVAIGYDRVTDGKLDATLVLIYPMPISDLNGFVYLPTYRSVYRLTNPALPVGADSGLHPTQLTLLPQPLNGTEPFWFSVPDGAVGRLPDAVVPQDDPAQPVVNKSKKNVQSK